MCFTFQSILRALLVLLCLASASLRLPAQTKSDKDLTVIQFDQVSHEFGTVPEGQPVQYSFRFTNAGKAPLVLKEVRPTCGCTIPRYPKEAIMPGESGTIEVTFHTSGKKGNQVKIIRVTANTHPKETELRLLGTVQSKKKKKSETAS